MKKMNTAGLPNVPSSFRLEMECNRTVSIEGCRSVISYQPEEIHVALHQCIFSVWGKDLHISYMNGNTMAIHGQILRMAFEE